MDKCLSVVQVNATDTMGGAAKIALELFSVLRDHGHRATFVVGKKNSTIDGIYQLSFSPWEWCCFSVADYISRRIGVGRLAYAFKQLARPEGYINYKLGLENFCYPGSKQLLKTCAIKDPDVIHFHNLHGGYFDLRLLPIFSNKISTVITLHDSWLLGGHCLHSMDCMRWQTGCSSCPYLSLAHAITKDSAAYNWKRKATIYSRSKLYIVTPSLWLMNKVKASMLGKSMQGSRVINNGVDLKIFKPAEKKLIREQLGLTCDAVILLFVAHGAKKSPWKDYDTFRKALEAMGDFFYAKKVLGVCLGDRGASERAGKAEIMFVGYENDPVKVVEYYQASDLYIHATKVDTFPNSILESLACGTPVIATAVCGIPEQIKSIKDFGMSNATGDLVGVGDVDGIMQSAKLILGNEELYKTLSKNAVADVSERFSLDKQVSCYVDFYHEVYEHFMLNKRLLGGR